MHNIDWGGVVHNGPMRDRAAQEGAAHEQARKASRVIHLPPCRVHPIGQNILSDLRFGIGFGSTL